MPQSGFEPRTQDTKVKRYTNMATAITVISVSFTKLYVKCVTLSTFVEIETLKNKEFFVQ